MNRKQIKKVTLFWIILIFFHSQIMADGLLDKANQAFDNHNYQTALKLYEQVIQKGNKDLSVVMWAANSAEKIKQYTKQIDLLRLLVKLDPQGLKARKLLIRALEHIGKEEDSEIEVQKLISLWKSKTAQIRKKEVYFIRNAFKAGSYNVAVFQYYVLEGDWAKRYHFLAQKKKDDFPYTVSFGSYPALTKIEREMGNIGKNDRVWHLDSYTGKKHFTHGFFEKELKYKEVKEMAIDIFKTDNPSEKAISSSNFNGGVIP